MRNKAILALSLAVLLGGCKPTFRDIVLQMSDDNYCGKIETYERSMGCFQAMNHIFDCRFGKDGCHEQ